MMFVKGLIFAIQCSLAIFVMVKSFIYCVNTGASVGKVGIIAGLIVAVINIIGCFLIVSL